MVDSPTDVPLTRRIGVGMMIQGGGVSFDSGVLSCKHVKIFYHGSNGFIDTL
jgi:hypothetical protein